MVEEEEAASATYNGIQSRLWVYEFLPKKVPKSENRVKK